VTTANAPNVSESAKTAAPSEIYIVRHGETAWTRTGQHTGWTDLALTPEGEEQARALEQWLRDIRFDQVFSSPLQRALRTCALAGFGSLAALDPDLVEWNYGDYEGRTLSEIHAVNPNWDLLRDGCPGGESVAQITERIDRIIARLQKPMGNVLIFSSSHLLRMLAARWLGADGGLARNLVLDPAGVSVLGYDHNGMDRVIRRWNLCQARYNPRH
jgi:broad specificity phosphatase PhoE